MKAGSRVLFADCDPTLSIEYNSVILVLDDED